MTRAGDRLPRSFFKRPSPDVARDLLGCWLVRRSSAGTIRVQLAEVEAYLGETDPASHARRGRTARNLPMYGPAGHAYVYFVYGMHHCLNVVTGEEGEAAAVLLRGALAGPDARLRLDGPGRLCRALAVDLAQNRLDLCGRQDELWLEAGPVPAGLALLEGPRVGVSDPTPWRFRLAARENRA